MDKLVLNIWVLVGLYTLVFFAIMADLWSGVRKAKQRDEARTSYGFRRTIDKLSKYYNVMIVLSIIDAMQILAIWCMNTSSESSIVMFPLFSLVGAIGIGLIELKSICESSDAKMQRDMRSLSHLAEGIVKNKRVDAASLVDALLNYLNEDDETSISDKKSVK